MGARARRAGGACRFAPWTMPPIEAELAGFRWGETYPAPIVSLEHASRDAREILWAHRKHPEVRKEGCGSSEGMLWPVRGPWIEKRAGCPKLPPDDRSAPCCSTPQAALCSTTKWWTRPGWMHRGWSSCTEREGASAPGNTRLMPFGRITGCC